jgi:ribonuclease HI
MSYSFKIYTDGGSRGNPGKAASAAVIYPDAGKERLICGKYLGVATNNVAEYTAVRLALEKLVAKMGEQSKEASLSFYTDSNLVASQLSGTFKIKNLLIQKLVIEIRELEKKFQTVSYTHIPREKNKEADLEVNKILDQN